MIEKPVFVPSFHVEVVDPEGVFLLSERGHVVLHGPLHCHLARLMDGRRTADDIVDRLAGTAGAAEVYFALGLLESKGYIAEADGALPSDRAAFWHTLGVDAHLAERRLREVRISLAECGSVPVPQFTSALAALDIQVGGNGDLTVVLTDDYLHEGLDRLNVGALTTRRPWMLVKPVGTVLWIGPVFRPGATACWECLAHRLRANREVESYLHDRQGTTTPFPTSQAVLPATVQATLHLAAMETAKAVVGGGKDGVDGDLITLDALTLETQRHTLVRRPQCRRCGRPTSGSVPVSLQSRRKRFTADGGHRTESPDRTFAQYEHHISPITGAVSSLTRVTVDPDDALRVYVAGHGVAMKPDSLYFLRHGLLSMSGGKGVTDAQARASALCEALERHSGNFQGDEIRRVASYRRLGSQACHPNACMLISEAQYRNRDKWNALASRFHRIPEPLDETAEIEWTPVWSLTERVFRYLPTSYCYYGYPTSPDASFCWADSNGSAAGNTLEEAILQGFMELVERDSVCLWWYNRVRRSGVDLDSFGEPYVEELRKHYTSIDREVWVLDLTSDLDIPTFAAISRRCDSPREEILLAFGAHFDARIALLRALTELNQYFGVLTRGPDESGDYSYADPDRTHWWKNATVANQPYLVPDESRPRTRADYEPNRSEDVREDVLRCQAIVERQGMEMLVLDQTRPDIGLSVVKVVVPGLRHHWVRLGPGRLYDVPAKLGWLDEPLAEDRLNPLPMFV